MDLLHLLLCDVLRWIRAQREIGTEVHPDCERVPQSPAAKSPPTENATKCVYTLLVLVYLCESPTAESSLMVSDLQVNETNFEDCRGNSY